jgi:hypothetical protein
MMTDLSCARVHVLGALYAAASTLNLPTLADGGYDGAGIGLHTPAKQPAGGNELDADTRTYNMLLRATRCSAQHAASVNAASPY